MASSSEAVATTPAEKDLEMLLRRKKKYMTTGQEGGVGEGGGQGGQERIWGL